MWRLCFGTDSKYIIQEWTRLSELPIPIMKPLHLAVGSDLNLAEEQLCHWRVKKDWRQNLQKEEGMRCSGQIGVTEGEKKHWKKTERRSKMGGGEMGWEEIQKPEKKEEDGKVRIGRSEGQGNPFLWKFTCQAGRLLAANSRKIYLTSASRGDKRVDWQRAESHFWSCVLTSDSSSCLLSLNRATLPIQTKVTDQSTAPLSWCTTPQANRVQTHTHTFTHTHTHPWAIYKSIQSSGSVIRNPLQSWTEGK